MIAEGKFCTHLMYLFQFRKSIFHARPYSLFISVSRDQYSKLVMNSLYNRNQLAITHLLIKCLFYIVVVRNECRWRNYERRE